MAEAPLGVKVISAWKGIAAVMMILAALGVAGLLFTNPILAFLPLVMLPWGIFELVLAWGLWKLRSWALWISLGLYSISLISGVWAVLYLPYHDTVLATSSVVSLVITGVIVLYLISVRENFE